ncbi:MAG: GNAT family N-acetyltransferase [Oscillospiraceae bacterium]|nr:GNAT family N-acetyltransferase [Oscillospiraceae bacterium]
MIDSIRETDKEDYFINISHDKKVLASFICRYADTMEEFDFSSYLGRQDLFAIRLKETGRLVGILSLFDEKDGACEIGYGIGSRFWNQGYATEAVRRFLEYLFREKGMRTVYASFFTGNDASRRVMEKCGMRFDHLSEKELRYLGIERDLSYYAIRRKPDVILLNGPSSAGKSSPASGAGIGRKSKP